MSHRQRTSPAGPAPRRTARALPVSTYEEQSRIGERHDEREEAEAEDDVQESQNRPPGSFEADRMGLAQFVHPTLYRHGSRCS